MSRYRFDWDKYKSGIIKRHKAGQNLQEIAEWVGTSSKTIARHLERWGVREIAKRPPRWTPKEDSKLRQLKRKGYTSREISEVIGRSEATVVARWALIREGNSHLVINDPLPIEEVDLQDDYYVLYKGEEDLAEGTIDDIAHQLGLKPSTVAFCRTPSYKKRTKPASRRVLVKIGKAHEFYF